MMCEASGRRAYNVERTGMYKSANENKWEINGNTECSRVMVEHVYKCAQKGPMEENWLMELQRSVLWGGLWVVYISKGDLCANRFS